MTGFDLRSPGLDLEAVDAAAAPTLSTAVTAFVGIAERGPLHRPQPIASWGEFLDVFGTFVPYGHLAEAVYGFFLNGGERCIVVRVADVADYSGENLPGDCPRVGLLLAAANGTPVLDRLGDETIALTAMNEGSWGNELRYSFQPASKPFMPLATLAEDAAASSDQIRVAPLFDMEPGGTLRLQHPTDPLASRIVMATAVDVSTGAVTLQSPIGADLPSGSQVLGRGFKLVVTRGDQGEVFDNLSMSPGNLRYFPEVINGPPNLTDHLVRQRRGHSILVRLTQVLGPGAQLRFRPADSLPTEPAPPLVSHRLSSGGDGVRYAEVALPSAGGQTVATVVVRSDAANAEHHGRAGELLTVEVAAFQTETALPVPVEAGGPTDTLVVQNAAGFAVGDVVTVTDPLDPLLSEDRTIDQINEGNALRLAAPLTNRYGVGAMVTVQDRVTLSVFRAGEAEALERHHNLSGDPAHPRGIAAALNAESALLCAEPPEVAAVPALGLFGLQGGVDPGEIDPGFYTGYEAGDAYFQGPGGDLTGPFGVAAIESLGEVNLVAVPDLVRAAIDATSDDAPEPSALLVAAQRQVLFHCAKMGERFALLDPLPEQTPDAMVGHAAALSGDIFAKFGALYYPWVDLIYRDDKRRMPPSGPVAGLIARSDRAGGVNQAPSNLPILGVVDLEQKIDQETQDDLNPGGVNCIRKMRDGAILLWGARSLSQDLQARYVNVRRVLLGVNKFLSHSLLWAVFEPIGPALWQRIEAALTAFLQSMLASGMTAGKRPAEAFYAKCNAETNPAEVTQAGQVVAEIGLALMAPAEFIVLSVRRTADAVNVVEEDV